MSASCLVDKVAVQVGYTCMYAEGPKGCNGCDVWILELLAQHRHLAAIHQDPPRLALAVRAPTFSMHALVIHAPIEGPEDSEAWWAESRRSANNVPSYAESMFFV